MSWSVDFDPVVPLWLVTVLAAIGLGLLVFALTRRMRGTWIRAAALAALVLALLGPVVVSEEREPLSTVVAIVVDQSQSQTLDGRDAATAAMQERLAADFAEIPGIEVRTIVAGRDGTADGTQLFNALDTALADVPTDRIGAVVMLTDGQVHDAPAGSAGLGGAPVHALITGRANETDRRIVIDDAPLFGIVGEGQTIAYRVLDDGAAPGASVRVEIRADGEPVRTELVTAGTPTIFRFTVPHGGQNIIELIAEPLGGELTAINNTAVIQLNGIRDNLRVLLVSGEPHAGERTWRDLLKSDPSVDLIHFTILRPQEKQDGTPVTQLSLIAFPTRELFVDKLSEFDLVIFDRYQDQGVLPPLYFDNLTRYVEDGGALLIAAGPDDAGFFSIYNTSLQRILPVSPTGDVVETPYYARVTEAGFRHPVTRDLAGGRSDPPAWSRWFRLVAAEEPRGDVIMEGPDHRPLLVLGHEREGRVAMLLSDHAWLWARGYEGGGPHVDLLRNLSHWLMKEPDLEEETLRARAENGNLIVERQTMADTAAPVTLTSPGGALQALTLTEIEPGLWRGTVTPDETGLWRAEDGDLLAVAHVGPPNPREFIDVRSTLDVLRPAVDADNGYLARMTDGAGNLDVPRILPIRAGGNYAGGDWMGVRVTEASVLLGIDRVPLLAGFLGLAILLGLVATTWYREGR